MSRAQTAERHGDTVDPFADLPDVGAPDLPPIPDGEQAELGEVVEFRPPTPIAATMAATFPPVRWIVEGVIPEGLTLLAGPPKLGKSWFTLDMAIAVATGGNCLGREVAGGDVLLMALEDNDRRIQNRMNKVLPHHEDWGGMRLSTYTLNSWDPLHTLDAGALDAMDAWRASVASPRVVVVDVLAKVKPVKRSGESDYDAMYRGLRDLHAWAAEHSLSVVVVHHTRKGARPADPFEAVSGTMAFTAVPDATLVMFPDANGNFDAELYGRGRDVAEFEEALNWEHFRWQLVEDADAARLSDERRAIHLELEASAPTALSVQEIADLTSQPRNNVDALLAKMKKAGQVQRVGRGLYTVPKATDDRWKA